MTVAIGLVWAQARGGVIGADGGLPWHLPEDLARFKALTMGATVVMGRVTWESLPDSVRPLPGRRNVVLTRQEDWLAEGAEVVHSAEQALAAVSPGEPVWVIGGASVYQTCLPYALRAVVTEIDVEVAGDTYAPELGATWLVTSQEPDQGWLQSTSGLSYRVLTHERRVTQSGTAPSLKKSKLSKGL